MRSVRALLLSAVSLLAAPAGADSQAPCTASVRLEPERAYVGQQVIYRLQTLRREGVLGTRWLDALAFPGARAEWLPGRSPDPRASDLGPHRLVYEERRALFPARHGLLELPPARMLCRLHRAGALQELPFEVPSARLEVLPLPLDGRPADFHGLVGRVRARAQLGRQTLQLGESVSYAVTLDGPANLWRTESPLAALAAIPELEVFAQAPSTSFEAGERLSVRHTFVFDLVPHRTGSLVIPALGFSYFDPERGRYARAEVASLALEVRPAETAPVRDASGPAAARATAHPPSRSWPLWLLAGVALGLAVGAALARRRLRAPAGVRPALEAARRAEQSGDARARDEALCRALRAALAGLVPGAAALSAQELLLRPELDAGGREAAELLVALERARFSDTEPADATHAPDPARVRASVENVLHAARARRASPRQRTASEHAQVRASERE